ncbi:amino acid/polyamine transporter I [Fusarium flagelliforme]|uniref:amino acid/polyamine transporter I n=1 Tax=Fusarium flagelliforme TaxID=2675880 RepID=UPI001E8EF49C|nr:amino acid/polyamine transporter I [Fusarium flagelliforme]KAH7182435.1 amino acid/polyamine transporter I [Fusarium flagelliforme]
MTSSMQEGVLQQRLSTLTMVAMAFAILNTWIALAGVMAYILPSGGQVSFIYGFIVCVFCNLALAASLGELAALWPTAGGQYHFMYALCTPRWKRPMSFFVGWTNIAGWLTVVTTQAFFAAQLISAAAVVASNNAYEATAWKTYLFFVAILSFGTVGNIWGNRILGRWNDCALYWSVLSVVIISIILLSMSPKTDAKEVFTGFNNETGWSDGVAWILGLLQSALSLIGFDVVLHLTEEMPNPSKDAPRAMLLAVVIGGVTGLFFILVILFCLTDPTTILTSSTGMPIVELFLQSTSSRAAATILALMLSICFINGTSASITSASRLIFAMARDNGIVCHKFFAHISPRLDVPVRTIMFCYVFNLLFGLLYLGPTVAFSAYIASCTIFLNVSYASPVVALLVRGRGVLREYQTKKTPARMGLRFGAVVNCVAAVFVIVTSIFFCFPAGIPVSANTMNYVSPVVGGFYFLLAVYWLIWGKNFQGPNFDAIIGQPLQEKDSGITETVPGKADSTTKV